MLDKRLIDDVIKEFGKYIGIEELKMGENGILCLEFENSGNFYVELCDDRVLLYLSKELRRDDKDVYIKALRSCHYKESLDYRINVGLKGEDNLIFLIKARGEELDLPFFQKALDTLFQLHNNL